MNGFLFRLKLIAIRFPGDSTRIYCVGIEAERVGWNDTFERREIKNSVRSSHPNSFLHFLNPVDLRLYKVDQTLSF